MCIYNSSIHKDSAALSQILLYSFLKVVKHEPFEVMSVYIRQLISPFYKISYCESDMRFKTTNVALKLCRKAHRNGRNLIYRSIISGWLKRRKQKDNLLLPNWNKRWVNVQNDRILCTASASGHSISCQSLIELKHVDSVYKVDILADTSSKKGKVFVIRSKKKIGTWLRVATTPLLTQTC